MDYSSTSLDDVRSFLEGPHRAVLATVGSDGSPHMVVVDYLVEPDGLLLNGRASRRWARNVRDDPRVSAMVHDHDDASHWVRLTGRLELVREADDAAVEDAMVMARRYGDDPEQFRGQHRVTWHLAPHQVIERGE